MSNIERFDYYQGLAKKTTNTTLHSSDRVIMCLFGLIGECGEVVDELKKLMYHRKAFDRSKLIKEMGDVLWYLSDLASIYQIPLSEIAGTNIEKLAARHGDKFKNHDEQNKQPDDKQ